MLQRFIAAVLLAGLLSQGAIADELTPAKRQDIERLMNITGAKNIAKQFAAATSIQMFRALKASRPDIPDRAFQVMNQELLAMFSEKMDAPGGLLDKMVPIYSKYFTDDEVKQLLAFYQTPLGAKSIRVLPQVVHESMQVGQQWGQELAPEIQSRVVAALKREGILPQQPAKKP